MELFKKLKIIYQKLSLKLFGNTLGIYINILYLTYHYLSKKKIRKGESILVEQDNKSLENRCEKLLKKGVIFLEKQIDIQKIKEKFDFFFSDENKDKYSNYDAPGYRFLKREKVKDFESEIKHILDSKIDFFLKKYFKSNYKIFWVNILQMTPVKNHDDDESLLWHYDDNPIGILKIFIYCSNQDKDTGAFTFIELEKSEKIKCDGFFTYTTEDRIKNQNMFFKNIDNTDINIAAGAEGSILVFQNNIVHKGNLPLRDKRNLIALEVMPSTSEMTDEDLRKVLEKPFTIDFPKNPFSNN
jgi:hypothetical protein